MKQEETAIMSDSSNTPKMSHPRYLESLLRQLLEILPFGDPADPEALAKRLDQLRRHLAPEDEFALILSWLGNCRLVHKLSQEQLPLQSPDEFRVPDILAVFDWQGKHMPVLIEVKTSHPRLPKERHSEPSELGTLSLNPGYLRYAEVLGLPMLVAWRCGPIWTLFEMKHAELARINYKIKFSDAMSENLLGLLADDFSYRVVPGTTMQMRIKKLSEPDSRGSFQGVITDACVINAEGERVPNIPHSVAFFLFYEDEVEVFEEGDDLLQNFIIQDSQPTREFASGMLSKILHAYSSLQKKEVDWRAVIHNVDHWAHDRGHFHEIIEVATRHGIVSDIFRQRPRHAPAFLGDEVER